MDDHRNSLAAVAVGTVAIPGDRRDSRLPCLCLDDDLYLAGEAVVAVGRLWVTLLGRLLLVVANNLLLELAERVVQRHFHIGGLAVCDQALATRFQGQFGYPPVLVRDEKDVRARSPPYQLCDAG